jgi:predicted negative regulator of RcsB-dependent stress response
MRKRLFLLFFACLSANAWAQSDYLNSAYAFYQKKYYSESIVQLQLLKEKYPDLCIVPIVNIRIAELQYLQGQTDKAITMLQSVIADTALIRKARKAYTFDFPIFNTVGEQPWVVSFGLQGEPLFMARRILANISVTQKQYDKAVEYLNEAKKVIPYTSCVNGYNMYLCRLSDQKSEIYLKKGDLAAATNALLDVFFCQDCNKEKLVKKLTLLLNKQYTKAQVKEELSAISNNPKFTVAPKGAYPRCTVSCFKHETNLYYWDLEDPNTQEVGIKKHIQYHVKDLKTSFE